MSFRAVTEAVVHFESFRNIDLFHQGIYFLRTSLYYQKENNVPHLLSHNITLVLLCLALHHLQRQACPRELAWNFFINVEQEEEEKPRPP